MSPGPMDSGDWEPLEPARLGMYPGEDVEFAEAKPEPPPRTPRSLAEAESRFGADEKAEQSKALRELRQRIDAASGKRSLVDQIAARELRRSRRRCAAKRAIREIAVRSPITAADVPLVVQYDDGAESRDPREDQDWFKQLPPAERERLHDAWARKRGQTLSCAAVQRRTRARRIGAAVVVFAATGVLGTPAVWPVTVTAGVFCALVWSYTAPCRYRDAIVALGCFYTVSLIAWIVNGADGMPPGSFMDSILLVSLSAIAGFDAEIRRAGGFDACR